MLDSCGKHPHEKAVALCRRCGGSWCNSCLIYAFGPNKPPYCMSCAMVAGGVRTTAALPAMPRRVLKAQTKAVEAEAKAAAKATTAPEPEREPTDAYGETDWSTPWWEDRQPILAD